MRWIMLRLDQLAPTMGVESWIIMASGAFLLSLCFLVSFIAADAGRRRPVSRVRCNNFRTDKVGAVRQNLHAG